MFRIYLIWITFHGRLLRIFTDKLDACGNRTNKEEISLILLLYLLVNLKQMQMVLYFGGHFWKKRGSPSIKFDGPRSYTTTCEINQSWSGMSALKFQLCYCYCPSWRLAVVERRDQHLRVHSFFSFFFLSIYPFIGEINLSD